MPDEDLWEVPVERRAGLATHNERVRSGGRDEAVLYYPGSGADILHALFATSAKTRYFIFVDPVDLDQSLRTHIKAKHSRLDMHESLPITGRLGIRSRPASGWMFSMQGKMRFLFHFNMQHDAFCKENRGFICDTVFEKDFWETEDEVELSDVLAMLRVGGHYSTNASLGLLIPILSLVGLDYVDTQIINGNQYLFKRRTATLMTWPNLRLALDESLRVVQELICEETSSLYYGLQAFNSAAINIELRANQAAILQPFLNKGITLTPPINTQLCRQLAIKAAGSEVAQYLDGINLAFPTV
ncbi:hypothetical protein [Janthinobacterium sp. 1_2014MBL_MicDiv]|uniref:hypothetical protein n=1 Tax=Janthinobacterium sp. 1_2014MBL_MicDiv TaxID=1644131 RepID=UPI0008F4E172|nr:hypothetical protein [Janthinobacterium sp. 1_2014MBL_MicDiv]APA68701.1 hypothetical protein YQ44_13825 [Janthinobacterium sp. 1_2014MBL_MicDiv]